MRTRSLSFVASSDASSARRDRSGILRRSRPPWNGRSKTKYSIASLLALSIAFCSALKSGTPRLPMTTISPSIHAESIASAFDRDGERLQLRGPVVAAARDQLRLAAFDARHQPVAVELGLDDPVARGR
jgi:hypothetical protein